MRDGGVVLTAVGGEEKGAPHGHRTGSPPETISDETTRTEPRRAIHVRSAAAIVVTTLLNAVPFIGAGDTQDGSHAFAESQRMQSLTPVADVVVDTSHETAEMLRMLTLRP